MARSGEEALREILHREFALILLDVQMADMNGFETAGYIKQHPRSRHIPIIFITAVNRDAVHVFRGYSHGAVDYLVKPFDADILRSKAAVFVELYVRGEKLKLQERCCTSGNARPPSARARNATGDCSTPCPSASGRRTPRARSTTGTAPASRIAGSGRETCARSRSGSACTRTIAAEARAHWEAGLRSGAPFERQVRIKRAADGSYRWHLARAVPERETDGTIVGVDRHGRPTSTTRSAPRRRCARRSSCATTSCRSRRTSCARR